LGKFECRFHWHVMVYAPNCERTIGGNVTGSHLPAGFDDVGTPFAVVTISVDDKHATKADPEVAYEKLPSQDLS